jgi:hypothetical protein
MDAANDRIDWSTLDDSLHGTVSAAGAAITAPEGLAIDPPHGLIYWANAGGTHPISYAHLDGSGGGNLSTAGATVGIGAGPAIDVGQQRIYWANPAGNTISFANLDGSGGGGDLPTTGATVSGPTGVTIDEAAGRIYWANEGGSPGISYANLDGSGGANLSTTGATLTAPFGIAVDPTTGVVYWANQTSTGSISYLAPSGNGTLTTPGLKPTAPAYPSLLYPPQAMGTATISGGAKPGSELSCSASWAPDLLGSFLYRAPQTLTYQWQRDGVDIPGANASTLNAQANGSYACRVTAANAAGTGVQTSPGHPVATLSAVAITSPSTLFQLRSQISTQYSAADSAGPAAVSYDVQYQRARWNGGFGPWVSVATRTTDTSESISGSAGYEYCVRVRAHDTAGNVSAWATRCTAIPLDDRALSLVTENWNRTNSSGAYDGTLTTTGSQGARLRLTGARVDDIAVVVTECPTCGKVGLYLGGALWTEFDTHAATTHKQVLLVTAPFALRKTSVVLRAMDAQRQLLIDGLGIART